MALFASGSTVQESWLGMNAAPTAVVNPVKFQPSNNPCEIIVTSHTNCSKKVGMPWNRHYKTEWFAKVTSVSEIEIESEDVDWLNNDSAYIPRSYTLQLNPSLIEGVVVGPFKSKQQVLAWIKDKSSESQT